MTAGAIHPKVLNAAIVGSGSTIILWVCKTYLGVQIPGDVAGAIITFLMALAGYQTPSPK